MKTFQVLAVAVVLVGFVTSSFAAKNKPQKGGKADKEPASAEAAKSGDSAKPTVAANMKFSVEEQRVIESYVTGKKQKDLPPGLRKKLAKGGSLPPGWQKKLAAGEVMPADVFAAAAPLPPEIVMKLPPPPRGIITVTIEGKAVRLIQATREIIDVFEIGRPR